MTSSDGDPSTSSAGNATPTSSQTTDTASSSSAAATSTDDRGQLLAQAIRFLTSARVTGDATDDTKREFLRSKGLTEDEIHAAFRDATPPSASASSVPSHATASAAETDAQAFERAAKEFDDPINAASLAPPPRTYPTSPLALYYEAPSPQATGAHPSSTGGRGSGAAAANSPLTRYQVLLQFFKTLSYLMMLGGGVTALSVALWRTYVLPRITATFDARSIVLSHHHVLYDKLRASVRGMATYLPASTAEVAKQQQQQQQQQQRKGVLKKVHFGDEVDGGKLDDSQRALAAAAGNDGAADDKGHKTEKVVLPGTDVEVDARAPDEKQAADPAAGKDGDAAAAEGAAAGDLAQGLEPIDLTEPLRQSISRLAAVLRADMSSAAVGKPLDAGAPVDSAASGAIASATTQARPATVSDADSESGSEWSDSDTDTVSDDGLEFDPYGSYTKKKHTQTPTTTSSTSGRSSSSSSAKRGALKSSLTSLSADISSRQFMATNQSFANSTLGMRFGATPAAAAGGSSTSATGAGSGGNETRSGEIGQVKAEIRSLKGLLLSRRNFPSYAARPPPQMGERVGSTVV
ncbi:uncharacterized protein PFL1_03413 [Pseudozyma flocculosa PF-1]|uniref:Peroxisomal membrane protein PEX14 n=2 Tax=Pseudozyma flocculosa TaxID=84751 RepID=A0A5C3F7G8_9BASI|nr:uncharacterized protein PFL1_03413 [Pseudozyma flocculosa PF-1]EPQ29125.1 hypothetical protein PFL1_03413 [Pseudozyma flocculosa PF-1]SPO40120.1 uncharacterized protein PSFLO_05602 [Pseudozyma flocculosa]